jgi:glycine/D-amino acid oxidase-like deaminating enzyme
VSSTEAQRRWREENQNRVKEYERRRREKLKLDPERQARRKASQKQWAQENRERLRESRRKWREANPEAHKESLRRYHQRKPSPHHGYTPAQIRERLQAQGGCCALCKSTDPGKRDWQGDHDHATGVFRAVLCNRCNLGLGLFADDPDRLHAAAEYVARHRAFSEML